MAAKKVFKDGRWFVLYSDGRTGPACEPPTAAERASWAAEGWIDESAPRSVEHGVLVATGPVPWKHEVLDAVFAIDSHQTGIFASMAGVGADPGRAFTGVKDQLRATARAIGADAVAWCQFEYRIALGDGLFGKRQCVEIFAYGTAVKRVAGEPGGDEGDRPTTLGS